MTLTLSDLRMRLMIVVAAATGAAVGYMPGSFGVFEWFLLAPLLWATEDVGPGTAFLVGWLFGLTEWIVGMSWFLETLRRFTGLPDPAVWAIFLVSCAYHGLSAALWVWLVRALTPSATRLLGGRAAAARVLVAAAAASTVEGFFSELFPVRLADTQSFHLPMVQSVDIFGTAGVAWLVAGFNAAIVGVLLLGREGRRRAWLVLAVVAAIVGANEAYGMWRIRRVDALSAQAFARGRVMKVAAVQAFVPPGMQDHEQDFAVEERAELARLTARAAAEGPVDLAVWPEFYFPGELSFSEGLDSAMPPSVSSRPFAQAIAELSPARVHLTARASAEAGGARYNMAFLAGPDHEFLGAAPKRMLVPFGEYMPFEGLLPGLRLLSPRTDDFTPGSESKVLRLRSGARVGVMVCYEDMFPWVSAGLAAAGAQVLVSMRNDIWFSRLAALEDLRFTSLRAVETHRWMVRAVNTGSSAIVDPVGRMVRTLPLGAPGVLKADIPLLDSLTIRVRVGRFFTFAAATALAAVALLDLLRRIS